MQARVFETVFIGILLTLCSKHSNVQPEMWTASAHALVGVAGTGAAAMNESQEMSEGNKVKVWMRICSGLRSFLLPADVEIIDTVR